MSLIQLTVGDRLLAAFTEPGGCHAQSPTTCPDRKIRTRVGDGVDHSWRNVVLREIRSRTLEALVIQLQGAAPKLAASDLAGGQMSPAGKGKHSDATCYWSGYSTPSTSKMWGRASSMVSMTLVSYSRYSV